MLPVLALHPSLLLSDTPNLSKITDRSFRYASPCQCHGINSLYVFVNLILDPPFPTRLFLHPSFLFLFWFSFCSPITPSLFYSLPSCFTNPTTRSFTSSSRTAFTDLLPGPFLFCFIFSYFFVSDFLCCALDWAGHLVSFWSHVNILYRIVWIDKWKSKSCKRFQVPIEFSSTR